MSTIEPLPLPRCIIHDRVKVFGKWHDRKVNGYFKDTIEKNERDIRYVDDKCDLCWSEKIPP